MSGEPGAATPAWISSLCRRHASRGTRTSASETDCLRIRFATGSLVERAIARWQQPCKSLATATSTPIPYSTSQNWWSQRSMRKIRTRLFPTCQSIKVRFPTCRRDAKDMTGRMWVLTRPRSSKQRVIRGAGCQLRRLGIGAGAARRTARRISSCPTLIQRNPRKRRSAKAKRRHRDRS